MRWTADQHDAWKAREAARANDQRAKADATRLTDDPGATTRSVYASAGRPVPQAASGAASSAPIYPLVGLCRAAGLPEAALICFLHLRREGTPDEIPAIPTLAEALVV